MLYAICKSPLGNILMLKGDKGIRRLSFVDASISKDLIEGAKRDDGAFKDESCQLEKYFSKKPFAFHIRLDLDGSAFELKVWRELLSIPYGEVRTYGDIARAIGKPGSARAIGNACGKNPVPIIVPCHRVIRTGGGEGGYTGGLYIKHYLLGVEGFLLSGQKRKVVRKDSSCG